MWQIFKLDHYLILTNDSKPLFSQLGVGPFRVAIIQGIESNQPVQYVEMKLKLRKLQLSVHNSVHNYNNFTPISCPLQ